MAASDDEEWSLVDEGDRATVASMGHLPSSPTAHGSAAPDGSVGRETASPFELIGGDGSDDHERTIMELRAQISLLQNAEGPHSAVPADPHRIAVLEQRVRELEAAVAQRDAALAALATQLARAEMRARRSSRRGDDRPPGRRRPLAAIDAAPTRHMRHAAARRSKQQTRDCAKKAIARSNAVERGGPPSVAQAVASRQRPAAARKT